MRQGSVNHRRIIEPEKLDVGLEEVRPVGWTIMVAKRRPFGPEASGAEAHEFATLNVGAKASTS
jgi:hypothetical protein